MAKVAALLCCLPALMGASVYRWVDDKGVVNYTQQKPPGVRAELIEASSGMTVREAAADAAPPAGDPAPAGASGAPATGTNLSEAQREALTGLEAAEQARRQEIAQLRQANCERARGVLERLSTGGRLRVRDAQGNEVAMSEEERQQRIAEAQRGVVENCVD
jgi:hypothetical protein